VDYENKSLISPRKSPLFVMRRRRRRKISFFLVGWMKQQKIASTMNRLLDAFGFGNPILLTFHRIRLPFFSERKRRKVPKESSDKGIILNFICGLDRSVFC
jgi:hypothetical protein